MKTISNLPNFSAVKTSTSTIMATNNNSFFGKATSTAEPEAPKSLVVVDTRVENYEQLIGGVKAGTEVFVLNPTREAIKQITEILVQRNSITSLHIVSHGLRSSIRNRLNRTEH